MADGYQEHMLSRSPYGERGLKSLGFICGRMVGGSLSLRRAWIEISSVSGQSGIRSSRSPYGERGLKCLPACWWSALTNVALLTESVD